MQAILSLLGAALLLTLSTQAVAQEQEAGSRDCAQCRERKVQLCTQECAAVPYRAHSECRTDCINEYCAHRCEDQLVQQHYLSCAICTDTERPLCRGLCDKGTEEALNACANECAAKRCMPYCASTTEEEATQHN